MSLQRRAMTLIELLIVVSIIGLLASLVLPAVMSVREKARKITCANNLRQIGLATQNFVSARGHFPTAGGNPEDFNTQLAADGFERAGWMFQLLPYMEEQAVYDLGHEYSSDEDIPSLGMRITEIPMPMYTCPDRGVRQSTPIGEEGIVYAFCDYAGVMHDWGDGGTNETPPTKEKLERAWRGIIAKSGHFKKKGPRGSEYYRYKPVTPAMVTDGLSKTILVMEKAASVDSYVTDGYWETKGWAENADWSTMRLIRKPLLHDSDPRTEGPAEHGFGSGHIGSINVAYGDGSMHAFSYDLSSHFDFEQEDASGILRWLGDRADGKQLDAKDDEELKDIDGIE